MIDLLRCFVLYLSEIFFYSAGNLLYLSNADDPYDKSYSADIQDQLEEIIFRQDGSVVMDGWSGSSESIAVRLLDDIINAFKEFAQMDASRLPFQDA
jgi:hypothetical protein